MILDLFNIKALNGITALEYAWNKTKSIKKRKINSSYSIVKKVFLSY